MKERALFLDRDGVVNREIGYVYRSEDIVFVEGIFSLCNTARKLGFRIVIVTNQSGIARGFYTEDDYHKLMQWMRKQFRNEGAPLDGAYHSPYHPEHGVGKYKREHEDRKPGAGMLHRAAHDLHLDLSQSLLIGDRCTDIAAAQAGGLRHAFFLRGTEQENCEGTFTCVDSLGEVEAWLLTHAQSTSQTTQGKSGR
jgi:D-glycero-D-manno-heptose 1,7-bisphosphate phosphatase